MHNGGIPSKEISKVDSMFDGYSAPIFFRRKSEIETIKSELEAERSWAYVRDNIYDIYTRHNEWDDSDANNFSHARFNIPELMRKHKEKFSNKCK